MLEDRKVKVYIVTIEVQKATCLQRQLDDKSVYGQAATLIKIDQGLISKIKLLDEVPTSQKIFMHSH